MSIPQLPNELFLQIREFADFDTRLRMEAVMYKETLCAVSKRLLEGSLFKERWKVRLVEDGWENIYLWIPLKRGEWVMMVGTNPSHAELQDVTTICWLQKHEYVSRIPYFCNKEYAQYTAGEYMLDYNCGASYESEYTESMFNAINEHLEFI